MIIRFLHKASLFIILQYFTFCFCTSSSSTTDSGNQKAHNVPSALYSNYRAELSTTQINVLIAAGIAIGCIVLCCLCCPCILGRGRKMAFSGRILGGGSEQNIPDPHEGEIFQEKQNAFPKPILPLEPLRLEQTEQFPSLNQQVPQHHTFQQQPVTDRQYLQQSFDPMIQPWPHRPMFHPSPMQVVYPQPQQLAQVPFYPTQQTSVCTCHLQNTSSVEFQQSGTTLQTQFSPNSRHISGFSESFSQHNKF